jgi:two-component system, NarL family, response regulator DesR
VVTLPSQHHHDVTEEEPAVICAVIAHRVALVRGALAFVLSTEDDIQVVAELERAEDVEPTLAEREPDVAVVDLDLVGPTDLRAIHERHPCPLLVLADARRFAPMIPMVTQDGCDVGFLATDGPPDRLVDAVRRAAEGERVIDPELVVAALGSRCPLTPREIEVLAVTAGGGTVKEVATQLALSPGTVRNHLSRILTKIGARSRIEAIRMAHESGWI